MSEIKITQEQAKSLDDYETVIIDGKEFKIHEEGEYVNDHKDYDLAQHIISGNGKFWSLGVTRSGSYYSDYYYDFDDCLQEVEQVEVVKKVWQVV